MKSAKRKLETVNENYLSGKCQDCASFKIDLNSIDNNLSVHTCKHCRKIYFINSINSFNSMLNSFQTIQKNEFQNKFDTLALNSKDKCLNSFIYEPFNISQHDVLPLDSVYVSELVNERAFSFKDLVNSFDNFKKPTQFELKSKKLHISSYSSLKSKSICLFDLKKKLLEISLRENDLKIDISVCSTDTEYCAIMAHDGLVTLCIRLNKKVAKMFHEELRGFSSNCNKNLVPFENDLLATTLIVTFELEKEKIPQTLLNLDSFFSLISNEKNKKQFNFLNKEKSQELILRLLNR